MPTFLAQLHVDYNRGSMPNGSTEHLPNDLADEQGHRFALAKWPIEPLEIEAETADEAMDLLETRHRLVGETIFRDNRVDLERYEELRHRPRTGTEGPHAALINCWRVKLASDTGPNWNVGYQALRIPEERHRRAPETVRKIEW
jgi:hypothetical protein